VGYLRVAARWPVQVVNPLCKRYAETPLLGDLRVAGSFSVLFFKGLFIFSLTVLYAVARTGTVPTWKAVLPGSDGKACTPSYSVTGGGGDYAGVGFHHRRGRPVRNGYSGITHPRKLRRRSLTTTDRLSVDWGWHGLVRCFSLPGWVRAGCEVYFVRRDAPRPRRRRRVRGDLRGGFDLPGSASVGPSLGGAVSPARVGNPNGVC